MKKSKYSEEQIIGILKEAEAGIAVSEICRKYGISDADLLQLEGKIRGNDGKRRKEAKAAGGREPAA